MNPLEFEISEILDFKEDHIERVFGVAAKDFNPLSNSSSDQTYYLVCEAMCEPIYIPLRSFLLNHNYKLEIFGKIRIVMSVVETLSFIHSRGLVCSNLNINKIHFKRSGLPSFNVCKVTGLFIKENEKNSRKKDISDLMLIMEQVFFRMGNDESNSLKTFTPKNIFEQEYANIFKLSIETDLKAENIYYQLSKILDLQWAQIQIIAKKKKDDSSNDEFLVLKSLNNHVITSTTSLSSNSSDSKNSN